MEKKMDKFMKRATIGSVMRGICYGFAALLFAASCANDDVAQDEKRKKDNIPAGTTVFTGTSLPDATTRTAILNHTKGAGASVNWDPYDFIWVKDDGGTWWQSQGVTFPVTTDKTKGVFTLNGTFTGNSYDIVYSHDGYSGSQQRVYIKKAQTQSVPNNFDHAGESGDCGIATAYKVGDGYKFTLNHKAAYLCFIPRSSNPYINRSKLIKVEIISDDDIAGFYDIASDGTLTLASGGSKTITVTTGSGFAIDNSTENMSKNATYAVIAPGFHSFCIRYWLRNTIDNPNGVEGTVTKYVTVNCAAGSISDITSNLDINNYGGDNYYMWDAQQPYWKGHEWSQGGSQPNLTTQPASNDYAQNDGDLRYYHKGLSYLDIEAKNSCKPVPNVNEMAWYADNGDARWDDELWTAMGHLYKGGMWFKKKTYISGFNANNDPDGRDRRGSSYGKTTFVQSETPPSVGVISNYFFLPAMGYYHDGKFYDIGEAGYYWSGSSDHSHTEAYCLKISKGSVSVDFAECDKGFKVQKFE